LPEPRFDVPTFYTLCPPSEKNKMDIDVDAFVVSTACGDLDL